MNIVITGATGALGQAVVRTLQGRNKLVSLTQPSHGSTPAGIAEVAVEDLADPQATRQGMEEALGILGHIDAVVHLAGAFHWVPVAESTLDDWWTLYSANVATTLNVTQAALPHLKAGAAITCVGAASAQPAKAGMAPYGAAKSGVARLVEALSEELRPRRIRINAVAPSIIDTPRNRADMPDADFGEWTAPEAIAEIIAFLAGPQSRAINGALIPVTNNV